MPEAKAQQSLDLFTDHVLPALQAHQTDAQIGLNTTTTVSSSSRSGVRPLRRQANR
jgi:hypothetical protein